MVLPSIWKRRHEMFSDILRCYDELISDLDSRDIQECVETFLKINLNRQERPKELSAKNEFSAYKRTQQLVKEFLASDDDADFFSKIEEIRSKTLAEYTEQFNNKCNHWDNILDNKEKHFILLLKERLAQKPVIFENLGDKQLEWFVIGVDPFQHTAKLFLKSPCDQITFKENGYSVVEDGDSVFDCPELACCWRYSDVRRYVNITFYHQAFSDEERQLILETKRHINKEDFLIPNDISEDYVYLLDSEEFLMLPAEMQICEPLYNCDFFWLAEQKSRGWDDTGELPKIYVVECKTRRLIDATADRMGLLRVCVTLDLKKFINNLCN